MEETYKFREVVILADNHEPAEMREIAGKVDADQQGGLAFGEAVLKYSDAPSRFQEGMIGPLPAADIAGELLEALKRLEPGGFAQFPSHLRIAESKRAATRRRRSGNSDEP